MMIQSNAIGAKEKLIKLVFHYIAITTGVLEY